MRKTSATREPRSMRAPNIDVVGPWGNTWVGPREPAAGCLSSIQRRAGPAAARISRQPQGRGDQRRRAEGDVGAAGEGTAAPGDEVVADLGAIGGDVEGGVRGQLDAVGDDGHAGGGSARGLRGEGALVAAEAHVHHVAGADAGGGLDADVVAG